VPHLSIAGGGDRVVPDGALLAGGDGLLVERAGHNEVLYHPDTVAAVVARIRAAGGRSTGPRAA
jgi:predicted regulator of Ras-like GTPase activity (Roadblock/LC7/MglB family)